MGMMDSFRNSAKRAGIGMFGAVLAFTAATYPDRAFAQGPVAAKAEVTPAASIINRLPEDAIDKAMKYSQTPAKDGSARVGISLRYKKGQEPLVERIKAKAVNNFSAKGVEADIFSEEFEGDVPVMRAYIDGDLFVTDAEKAGSNPRSWGIYPFGDFFHYVDSIAQKAKSTTPTVSKLSRPTQIADIRHD